MERLALGVERCSSTSWRGGHESVYPREGEEESIIELHFLRLSASAFDNDAD